MSNVNKSDVTFRRISTANKSQTKSITKIPTHLRNAPLYQQIHWSNCVIVFGIPLLAIYGLFTTTIQFNTVIFALIYYFFTGMGVTAGYHRLWSHCSYTASTFVQSVLMIAASGALQGSAKYWSLLHRAHHRWTDTERDPYNFHRSFWYAHFGWLLFKTERIEHISILDLKRNTIIEWQHRNFAWFGPVMTLIAPAIFAWLFWNDFRGGFYIVGALRCAILHQGTWCVNSVAHSSVLGGQQNFDDTITPHDSVITAFLTFGEGYHNFHHEFPNDFRNGVKWYHYDPTKWFLRFCGLVGLVGELNECDANEIKRGMLDMREKNLLREKATVDYGVDVRTLAIWTMEEYEKELKMNKSKNYVIFNEVIHEIPERFVKEHPGGMDRIKTRIGTDITDAFNGTIYNHSNAARNILSHFRVARIYRSN